MIALLMDGANGTYVPSLVSGEDTLSGVTTQSKLFLSVSENGQILTGANSFLLTHCRLNELPHTIYWKILILIFGMSGYVIKIILEKNG